MIEELKNRFQIKRCIWVSDAGLLTEENLKVLKGSGYPFILGMGGEDIEVEAEKILHQCRVRKYFSYQADKKVFVWQEHTTAVEARKSNAGKYALMTNTDLPADQVLSAYRTLLAAEDAFLVLKDILDLRPVWHKCDVNVEGHVLLAVWSYLLYKTLEIRMEQKGIDFTAPRALNAIKAVQVATRDKAVWKLLKVPPQAIQAFEAVGVDDVNGHFKKWAANAPAYHYSPRLDPEYGRAP